MHGPLNAKTSQFMWILRFSQQRWWKFNVSGTLTCVHW